MAHRGPKYRNGAHRQPKRLLAEAVIITCEVAQRP